MDDTMKETVHIELGKDAIIKIALGIFAAALARQAVQTGYDKAVTAYRLRQGSN